MKWRVLEYWHTKVISTLQHTHTQEEEKRFLIFSPKKKWGKGYANHPGWIIENMKFQAPITNKIFNFQKLSAYNSEHWFLSHPGVCGQLAQAGLPALVTHSCLTCPLILSPAKGLPDAWCSHGQGQLLKRWKGKHSVPWSCHFHTSYSFGPSKSHC